MDSQKFSKIPSQGKSETESKPWFYKSKAFIPPQSVKRHVINSNIDILINACKSVFGETLAADTMNANDSQTIENLSTFQHCTSSDSTERPCWRDGKENWYSPEVNDSFLELESSYLALSPRLSLSERSCHHSSNIYVDDDQIDSHSHHHTPLASLNDSNRLRVSVTVPPRSQKETQPLKLTHSNPQSAVKKMSNQRVIGPKTHRLISNSLPSHPPCVSCKGRKSPCWRPSWSSEAGQLCNSCGLRFRKTRIRCVDCLYIPAKIELVPVLQNGASLDTVECPKCDGILQKD